jgi:hypothetical protein
MKKTYILLAAAAILAAAVSCNKEQEIIIEEPAAPANVQVNITVGDPQLETKAVKTGWEDGDIIHIYLDDNATYTPDFDLTYDGSAWSASAISSAVAARLKTSSGKLHGFWEASNSCMSSWTASNDHTLNLPDNDKIGTTGVATPMLFAFQEVDYTYDGATLTATILKSNWDFYTNIQFVITGITGSYTLYCENDGGEASRNIYNISYLDFNSTYVGIYFGGYTSSNGRIRGIANTDGLAFCGQVLSNIYAGRTLTLYLVDNSTSKTYSFSKVLGTDLSADNNFNAIKIPFSKFVPVGALKGKFTVAAGKQVYFSQGNLQATTTDLGANWTWAFAAHQWDYVGNATANNTINGNGKVSANGTVDLFGWVGASNTTWTGAAQYGISNSKVTNSTDTYGNYIGDNLKSDWGNTIGTGWRTLTKDEWVYLFNTRASGSTVNGTGNARYTYATINTDYTNVNGMILFPDGITIASDEATSWGTVNGNSDWGTKCTSAQWTGLAAKGCVFLPAAGSRDGSTVDGVGTSGSYWSSSAHNNMCANRVYFKSGESLQPNNYINRSYGYSVRLVHAAE